RQRLGHLPVLGGVRTQHGAGPGAGGVDGGGAGSRDRVPGDLRRVHLVDDGDAVVRGAGDGVLRDLPRGAARVDRGVGAADRVLADQGVGDVVAEADAVLGAEAHAVAGDLRPRGEAGDHDAAGVAGDGVVVQRRAGAAVHLDPVVAVGRDGAAGDG